MFYQANLGVFAAANALLLYRQWKRQGKAAGAPVPEERTGELENGKTVEDTAVAVSKFKYDFFVVYGLAMAADWMQGPHIYAIYKYEKNLPEQLVAMLYASGFVSGAVSASIAGELADRYGRRLACLLYCASYVATCLTMFSDSVPILFLGRLAGGVSTTLLYSVFDAWMITEYHSRGLTSSSLSLSEVFANMTTISGVVAIACGVVGDMLVNYMGGRVWPFVASIVCCFAAVYFILTTWKENYGAKSVTRNSFEDIKSGVMLILRDQRVLTLGLASTFLEGSMYLFIFFWSAALKSARTKAGSTEDLPYGVIFSSFMCAMMAGSAAFGAFSAKHNTQSTSYVLTLVVLGVSACLSSAVSFDNEYVIFWAFCLIEACVGAYYPSMGFLKSEVVEDGVRGKIYSILRFPLNIFVVVAHSLDEEGDQHRYRVFASCAAFLMITYFIIRRNFPE